MKKSPTTMLACLTLAAALPLTACGNSTPSAGDANAPAQAQQSAENTPAAQGQVAAVEPVAGASSTPSSPVTASASATPTARPSNAPMSDEKSVNSALAAYSEYLTAFIGIAGRGGTDESALAGIALDLINGGDASRTFSELAANGNHAMGTMNYKLLDVSVSTHQPESGGPMVPYGQVDMQLCLDKTEFSIMTADGDTEEADGPEQVLYSSQAVWEDGKWVISKDWLANGTASECDATQ